MGLISYLQSTAKTLLRLQGFHFETREPGPASLVLWRKPLRKPGSTHKRLIIIPGFGDTPMSWLPTVTQLQRLKAFREAQFDEIVMLEFSGYIGSLTNRRAIGSIDQLVTAVTSVLDELAPHTLVGQSMGGFISAYYAAELPARNRKSALEKLVLLCPSGMLLGESTQAAIDALLRQLAQREAAPFIRAAMGPTPANPLLWLTHAVVSQEFREFLLRPESLSLVASFEKNHEMNERASLIRTPTQLLWGVRDALIPFEASRLWMNTLSKGLGGRVALNTLAQGTHGLHIEEPRTVAEAIVRYV